MTNSQYPTNDQCLNDQSGIRSLGLDWSLGIKAWSLWRRIVSLDRHKSQAVGAHSLSPYSRGFTLIGALIYIASFAIIMVTVLTFLSSLIRFNAQSRSQGEVLDNARHALTVMTSDIRLASAVYTPTSTFASHPGQLSLATTQDLPSDETLTYVDFYLDDERLYVKREGSNAQLVTSERIKISNLTFTHLNQNNVSSIQIALTAAFDSGDPAAVAKSSISLSTSATLRAYE